MTSSPSCSSAVNLNFQGIILPNHCLFPSRTSRPWTCQSSRVKIASLNRGSSDSAAAAPDQAWYLRLPLARTLAFSHRGRLCSKPSKCCQVIEILIAFTIIVVVAAAAVRRRRRRLSPLTTRYRHSYENLVVVSSVSTMVCRLTLSSRCSRCGKPGKHVLPPTTTICRNKAVL